jgi:hypothetical protein
MNIRATAYANFPSDFLSVFQVECSGYPCGDADFECGFFVVVLDG